MEVIIREFDTPQSRYMDYSNLLNALNKKFPGNFVVRQTADFKHTNNTNTLYWDYSPSNNEYSYTVDIGEFVDGWISCLESM